MPSKFHLTCETCKKQSCECWRDFERDGGLTRRCDEIRSRHMGEKIAEDYIFHFRDEIDWRAEALPVDFSCRVCGIECGQAPNPPLRAVCPEHCDDHEFEYVRHERGHFCEHCGVQAPPYWYEYEG